MNDMKRFNFYILISLLLIALIVGLIQLSGLVEIDNKDASVNHPSKMPDKVQEAKFMARYNTPMAFFGKVVDQYGNPIVNADVKLTVLDSPWKDSEPIKMVTDASGGFQLTSGRGRSLFVSIRKSGYDWSYRQDGKLTSQKSFDYGGDSGDRIHRPDKASPVVFILRKPGVIQPLIIRPEFNFLLPDDGSVRRISLHPDHSPAHEISLSCKSDIGEVNAGEPYGWQFEISVPNGVLLERAVDSVYEAPDEDYFPSYKVLMIKSQVRWSDRFTKSYFVKYEDGIYARILLNVYVRDKQLVELESWLNPIVGSRHLEIPRPNLED